MVVDRQQHPAWQAAFTFTLLMLVGLGLRVMTLPVERPRFWAALATIYASLMAALLVRRRNEVVGTLVLAGSTTIAIVQVTVVTELLAREGFHVEPFIGVKLIALALALIAPPSLWVALVGLVATAVLPVAQFYHWPLLIRHELPINEPWTTLLYSAVALILLFHRRHQLEAQRKMVQAETRAASFELYMRKFLAVRDMTNSPLQSIAMTVERVRSRCPDAEPQLDLIERQLGRLRDLSAVLARYEPELRTEGDYALDPLEVLREPR